MSQPSQERFRIDNGVSHAVHGEGRVAWYAGLFAGEDTMYGVEFDSCGHKEVPSKELTSLPRRGKYIETRRK